MRIDFTVNYLLIYKKAFLKNYCNKNIKNSIMNKKYILKGY